MSWLRAFGRAALLRCPRCGQAGVLRRWTRLADYCEGCGHRFERHEGYWVGAVAINTLATIGIFFLVFVGGMVATWPDVPWNLLAVVTVSVNVVFPILFYPWSKALWMALDLSAHPLEDREIHAAAARTGSAEGSQA